MVFAHGHRQLARSLSGPLPAGTDIGLVKKQSPELTLKYNGRQQGIRGVSDPAMDQRFAELMQAGYAALGQGRWAEGRRWFESALARAERPEAYEALGMAASWSDDVPVVLESGERAYELYRQRDDRLGDARLATLLGVSFMLYRD